MLCRPAADDVRLWLGLTSFDDEGLAKLVGESVVIENSVEEVETCEAGRRTVVEDEDTEEVTALELVFVTDELVVEDLELDTVCDE